MPRTKVFISYSHKDARWLTDLRVHLTAVERDLDVWDDQRLTPGKRWLPQIQAALAEAKVALLLVSPDFLASRFITEHEVPALLQRAQAEGMRVLCAYVRPCLAHLRAYEYDDPETGARLTLRLTEFQGLNDPATPPPRRQSAARDRALAGFAEQILARAESGAEKAVDVRPYLEKLRDDTRWLDVRGIGAKVAERVELAQVYTRLRVVGPAREGAAEPLATTKRTRKSRTPGDELAARDVELRDLLQHHPHLVLVGDPGAGKTTFLNFVTLNLARALLGDDRTACLKRLGLTGEPPFPVLVRLGLFGQFLNAHPDAGVPPESAAHFKRYLDYLCRGLDDGLPETFLHARVRAGGCLLLLDGLDEVGSDDLRQRVGGILDEVVRAGQARGNRHVVTCRTRAYQGRAQLGAAFTRGTLVDFGPEQIRAFATQWSRAIYRVPPGEDGTPGARRAAANCAQLVGAIEAHPHVRPLTTNPLLLTILAVVHWNERKLPEQRAELYEAAVKYLLETRKTQSPYESTLRRDCLKAIALRLFEDAEGVRKTLGRREAAEVVAPPLGVELSRAVAFIEDEELHSGILVSRMEGEVEFWHPTFGEYLAALGLAWEPDHWERIRGHLFEERWNEVVLLLAGCLRSGGLRPASALIRNILEFDTTLAGRARAVGLVGRILRDILPAGGDPAYGTGYDEARQQVLAIFEKGSDVAEAVRVEVGEALGQAGDPRIDDDDHANRVFIKGGTFMMGAEGIATPVHRVTVSGFWIDRYPVTVAQYRRFVEAGAAGYRDARFWREGAWRDRAQRNLTGPREWEEQLRHLNRPVTRVSWYEADAYCAWLSARSGSGRRVSLPREAQWEYAARGAGGRKSPWGDEGPTDRHINFADHVGHATPVGIYPLGATPEGVQDLSGNVWEWCHDWHGAYEAREQKDPAGPPTGTARVLRGGGFGGDPLHCRAAFRHAVDPDYGGGNVGFRCVVLGGSTEDRS